MKRIIALVLSLVMALSLCAPAWGVEETISTQDAFNAAIAAGETNITLGEGEFTMPEADGKTLTISAADAAKTIIKVVPAGQGEANGQLDYSLDGATVTFNNVTIETNNQLYAGYARLSATYNKCIIQNTYNLGTGISEFNECVINITNEYLRINGANSATFNECVFNTVGKAILVFQDGTSVAQTVTVKDCTFNATAAAYTWDGIHVAAVSYDGSQGGTYVVNFEGNNVVDSDFNGLWQIKKGEANVTVSENGVVEGAVAKVGDKQYKSLQEALNNANGNAVELLTAVELAGEVTLPDGVTLDGKGFVISVNDSNYSFPVDAHGNETKHLMELGNNCTVKNVTLDSEGKAYGVQAYCKTGVMLNDVTVKNSAGAGLTVNGAAVTAVNLVTSGNNWGDVNVDPGSNVTSESKFAISGDKTTLAGGKYAAIWGVGDKVSSDNKIKITVSGGNYTGAMYLPEKAGSLTINSGYFTVDPSDYCVNGYTGVASDKAGYLYMVGEKGVDKPADVVVAAPEVTADTTNMSTAEKGIADALTTTENAVKLDESALTAKAADVANNTSAEATEDHADELSAALTEAKGTDVTVTPAEVTIVVQPYFDVEIKDVVVVEESGAVVSSVTIELDITPMYQTVATTADITVDEKVVLDHEDSTKINAVAVGTAKPLTVTEPVTITIKIPTALVTLAGVEKKLFVTHEASTGTYVYEATVDAEAETATFTNPHGFSSFSISATDNTVAKVGSDKYTNLQDAINNAGKDATITVVKGNNTAVVKGEISFTVVLETGATASISAGSGYTMTKEDVAGGVKYTFTKVTTGGYYPWYPTVHEPLVESANTFDAGVVLYVGVSVIGTVGAVALSKKKED